MSKYGQLKQNLQYIIVLINLIHPRRLVKNSYIINIFNIWSESALCVFSDWILVQIWPNWTHINPSRRSWIQNKRTGICCNSAQKQNPQICLQSWKSETYCHINCATRRYFFWWSVSESCDLKWPAVFSGFLGFLPIRWRTDLEMEEVENTENQVSVFSVDQTPSRFEKDKKLVGSSHKAGIMRHWLCSNWFQIVPWWDFNRFSRLHNAAQITHSL